jgi:hypothetical protein
MLKKTLIALFFLLSCVFATSGQTQQPLQIIVVQHEATLIWTATVSSGFTGYNVYRGTQSSGPFTFLASVPSGTNTYTDLTTQGDTQYCYVVTTYSPACPNTPTCGESAQSNSTCATVPPPGPTLTNPGGAIPTVSLSANTLGFGPIVQNTSSSTQTITVSNTSGSTITITGKTYSGTNASDFSTISTTCSTTLTTGSTCIIKVGFTPTAAVGTAETATFSFAYTGFTGSPLTVSLTGTSAATGSVLTAPQTSTAGNVQYGLSSSGQTVTVTNNSGSTITIGTVTYSGTNASDFVTGSPTSCGGTLATGHTCTVTPLFSPTKTPVASESATMSIPYTGFTGSPLSISLTGTSVTATGGTSVPLSFFGMSWFNSTYPFGNNIVLGTQGKTGHGGLAGQGQLIDNVAATCANSTSPTDPCYTWTGFDTEVNTAVSNGMLLIFDLDQMPLWMCPNQNISQSGNPHCVILPNLTAISNVMTAIATRYVGKIKYYETDNEVNYSDEWQDTCSNLVLLHNTVRAAIKAGDSNALVGAPNLATGHLGLTGSCTTGPAGTGTQNEWIFLSNFLQTRDSNGKLPTVDTVGHHTYQSGTVTPLDSVAGFFLTTYNNFRAVMTAQGISKTTPLLVTEGSWGLSNPNPNCSAPLNTTGCLSSQQQIAYVGRWLVLGASTWSDGGGQLSSWYAYDIVWGTLNGTNGMNAQNAPAYGQMETWLTGAKFTQQCATGSPSTVYVCPFTSTSLTQAEIVFNDQNGTAANFVTPSWAGHYQQLLGTTTAITGGAVSVNDTPILLTP